VILTRRAGALGMPGRATLGLTGRQLDAIQAGRRRGLVGGLEQTLARQALRTRIRHLLGGRVRHLVGGGGHLDERTRALFELGGFPIMEGYGLTESIGVATAKAPGEPPGPSVGRPIPGVELRLSPEGEILLRGPGLFAGYLAPARDAAAAVEVRPAIDAEGWFHTGDLGLLEDGALVLTGRREDLVHLATGTVVSPAPIERALVASGLARHAVACGEGQPFVGVLLWQGEGAPGETAEAAPPDVTGPEPAAIRRLLEQVNRGLGRGEQLLDFRVLPGALSPERGELSARGEPVRPVIHRRYREVIDSMYSGNVPPAPR
jgi:long-chain acyl-CoA synthetase